MTSNAQIAMIVEIAFSQFEEDHEFSGYGISTVVNAIHEILDRPAITSQSMYNKIKAIKGLKSMDGIKFNRLEASEIVLAYLTGKGKSESTKLSDAIKAKMAQALTSSETIEA